MRSPSSDLVEMEGVLRVVIENLLDAQEAMEKIGAEMKDEALKRHFLAEGLKRAQFRGDLETILHLEGVRDLHETGTAAGAFVRAWAGLKAALGGGDHALLKTAEEAEHAEIEAYNKALRRSLPHPVKELLTQQALQILASHDYVRAARKGSRERRFFETRIL